MGLLVRRGRLADNPLCKLLIGHLVLIIHILAQSLWRVAITKSGSHFLAFEPGHLIHSQSSHFKELLICSEDLDSHGAFFAMGGMDAKEVRRLEPKLFLIVGLTIETTY